MLVLILLYFKEVFLQCSAIITCFCIHMVDITITTMFLFITPFTIDWKPPHIAIKTSFSAATFTKQKSFVRRALDSEHDKILWGNFILLKQQQFLNSKVQTRKSRNILQQIRSCHPSPNIFHGHHHKENTLHILVLKYFLKKSEIGRGYVLAASSKFLKGFAVKGTS